MFPMQQQLRFMLLRLAGARTEPALSAREGNGAMLMKRPIAVAITAAAVLLVLAGCMLMPGRFVSDLALRRDGTFTFHYKGEIVLSALAVPGKDGPGKAGAGSSSKAASGENGDVPPFAAEPCTDPATDEAHPCSEAELKAQRSRWGAAPRADMGPSFGDKEQGRKMMQAMMGGLDLDDPKAAEAFAARLGRQQGWNSVVSKGRGKFEVDYTVSGRLDHDFTFPTIERLPMLIPFVAVIRRSDGTVRVDAPAFTANAADPMMRGFGAAMTSKARGQDQPNLPTLDGSFTLRTDGQILANNTDEGPQAEAAGGGNRLSWKVDMRTSEAPTALIKLAK